MEPAMMTWHVTKSPDSDFCTMGYHISEMEDALQPHDEEVCEELVYAMAEEGAPVDDDLTESLERTLAMYHGMPEAKTIFFTKKLWLPPEYEVSESMYDDLGYNYSRSTETARWLHDPDPQMSMFIEAHGGMPDKQPVLKRNTRMFVINNHNYLTSSLEHEAGVVFDYDKVLNDQFWHREMPVMEADERVLLRV